MRAVQHLVLPWPSGPLLPQSRSGPRETLWSRSNPEPQVSLTPLDYMNLCGRISGQDHIEIVSRAAISNSSSIFCFKERAITSS